jgi:serine/threonine protein kinase
MVLLMMQQEGWSHVGYTKAVDWWSLGVTMYKLLTQDNPFQCEFDDVATSANTAVLIGAKLEKYAALLEEVDYSPLGDAPDTVDCISKLLAVEEVNRLGYGPTGSQAVSSHPYFKTINWVELEAKVSKPPPLPKACKAPRRPDNPPFVGLEHMFVSEGKRDWLSLGSTNLSEAAKAESKRIQQQFEKWDYSSPAAVMIELENLQ